MGAFKFAAEIPKLKLQRSLCSIWLLVTEAPASVPRELHSQARSSDKRGAAAAFAKCVRVRVLCVCVCFVCGVVWCVVCVVCVCFVCACSVCVCPVFCMYVSCLLLLLQMMNMTSSGDRASSGMQC